MPELLSVIVRTIPGREEMLDAALFSLALQEHAPIEAVVVLHGPPDAASRVNEIAGRHSEAFAHTRIAMHQTPGDGRTRSLNLGVELATGRYLAFLDDDDLVYPAHYRLLIAAMDAAGCAWAYSDAVRAEYRNVDGRLQPAGRKPYPGGGPYSFVKHLQDNFLPLHSFLVDREATGPLPTFDEAMERLEDYDFLLKLAAKHPPAYVPKATCEYRIRTDGSNTVVDGTHGTKAIAKAKEWDAARRQMADRKEALIGWWLTELSTGVPGASVVPAFGVDPQAQVAQRIVDDHWDSTSWRGTAVARRLVQMLRRQPSEGRPIVYTISEAERVAADIRASTSWKLAAPLRWIGSTLRSR